ncbi:MAG: UbiA family prenyltransferase, partial [Polyangiaceae bacterium]
LVTGRVPSFLLVVVALDWFFINLLNRVTDIEEDLKNGIPGTARVAQKKTLLTISSFAAMAMSFLVTHLVWPALTPWRVAVQVVGFAYNYKIVPTPRGMSRLKEIYFFKNFGSSILFVLTCFVYPIVASQTRVMPWPGVVVLAAFFVPFELTFEILYDLRDIEGDRIENVPTYPVVHGVLRARQIIDALLLVSAAVLLVGLSERWIGLREGMMLAAPAIQFFFYRKRFTRGLTTPDCIHLTHLASALLAFYLLGNMIWLKLGMPANVML